MGKWSEYDEVTTIASDDDILFRDVSDNTLGETGTQKRIKKSKLLVAANIEDFDTEVSNNTTVVTNSNDIATNAANIATNTSNITTNTNNIALKANIDSPNFTGTPTAPTASETDDSTKIATTAFVKDAIPITAPYRGLLSCEIKVTASSAAIASGSVEIGGKIYHWDSGITFAFGSSGSNAASDDLVAGTNTYLYVDSSSLPASPATNLTAANFLNSNTAPTWNESKHGWYNGDDRCIMFLAVESASAALVKQVKSGKLHLYYDAIEELNDTSPSDQYVTLSAVPSSGMARMANIVIRAKGSSSGSLNVTIESADGTSSHTGNILARTKVNAATEIYSTLQVPLAYQDNTLYLEIGTGVDSNLEVYTNSFMYAEGF